MPITKKTLIRAASLLLMLALLLALPAGVGASRASKGDTPADRDDIGDLSEISGPSIYSDFSRIRVRLSIGETHRIDLDLYGSYFFGGSQNVYQSTVFGPYPIRITDTGSSVRATNRLTGEILAEGDSVTLFRTDELYEAGYAQLVYSANEDTLDRKYLGDFRFDISGGYLRIINTVSMAYYLYGIVGYELNPYCQPEALRAQAVAAKVYGMFFMDPNAEFDVTDGWDRPLYQAYRGFRENRITTMPYCLDVVGEAMAYQGEILPAFYGHSDGGETALPSQIYNPDDTRYDGGYATYIDDIEYENLDESRVLIEVEFGGTGDSSRFRDFLLMKYRDATGRTPVSLVSIDDLYTFDPKAGTTRNMQSLHAEVTVRLASGETESLAFDCPTSELRSYELTDIDGSGDSYSSYKYVYTKKYKMYWGKTKSNGYTLIFSRYGNGIGLSQMGAEIRANPATYAQDYHQILSFYYPNFQTITITEAAPGGIAVPVTPQYDVLAYGVSTVNDAEFLSAPISGANVLGRLSRNEHIDILGVTDTGWFMAVWNGMEGYISLDQSRVTMFPSPSNGILHLIEGATASSSVNLRAEPYIRSSNVIARLTYGTTFVAWTHIGKWYYVTTETGLQGFVSSRVVDFYNTYDAVGMITLMVPDPSKVSDSTPVSPPSGPNPPIHVRIVPE